MPFACKVCGYYLDKDEGAGYICPNCRALGSFERVELKKGFNTLFEKALETCKTTYEKHRAEKGDSWQTCDYDVLVKKFLEEIEEWRQIPGNDLRFTRRTPNFPLVQSKAWHVDFAQRYNIEELVDIVNVALMLIERLSNNVGK